VILADGGNVVMADSVAEGLAMLLEGARPLEPAEQKAGGEVPAPPSLNELDRIEDAITGLDEVIRELQEAVEGLRESLGESLDESLDEPSGGDSQ